MRDEMNTDWVREARARGERAAVRDMKRLALEFILMLVVTFTALHFVGFGAAMATLLLTLAIFSAHLWFITKPKEGGEMSQEINERDERVLPVLLALARLLVFAALAVVVWFAFCVVIGAAFWFWVGDTEGTVAFTVTLMLTWFGIVFGALYRWLRNPGPITRISQ